MAILNAKPRTATAEVVEDARLLVIDGRTLEQMVISNAEIAVRLIKKLARRLDAADALIEVLHPPRSQGARDPRLVARGERHREEAAPTARCSCRST